MVEVSDLRVEELVFVFPLADEWFQLGAQFGYLFRVPDKFVEYGG